MTAPAGFCRPAAESAIDQGEGGAPRLYGAAGDPGGVNATDRVRPGRSLLASRRPWWRVSPASPLCGPGNKGAK